MSVVNGSVAVGTNAADRQTRREDRMKEGKDESLGEPRGGGIAGGGSSCGRAVKWRHDEPLQRQREIKMEKRGAGEEPSNSHESSQGKMEAEG